MLVGLTAHALGDRSSLPPAPVSRASRSTRTPPITSCAATSSNATCGGRAEEDGAALSWRSRSAWPRPISRRPFRRRLRVGDCRLFPLCADRLINDGKMIDVVLPLAAACSRTPCWPWRYITEGSEKRYLRHAFEHYLNPDVIAAVVDDPTGLKLGGERRKLPSCSRISSTSLRAPNAPIRSRWSPCSTPT